jgi:AcrR family transcriptional regulator
MEKNTHKNILAETKELFFKYGIKSVTMDDIARQAGVSKKTLYQVFRNKEDLIETLLINNLEQNKIVFEGISKNSSNAVQEIMMLMEYLAEMFSEINPHIFYDLQKYHIEIWKIFNDFKINYLFHKIVKNIERGISENLYRTNINKEILAIMRIEQVEMALNPSLFLPKVFKIEEIQIVFLDHFLHGIATLKGYKLINTYKQIVGDK